MGRGVTDRERDLERIRATYARYHREGRDRLWNASNRGYARISTEGRNALVGLIRDSLAPGGTVVDVGCGTGDLLGNVLDAGMEPRWIGVDLREEVIEEARLRFPMGRWLNASADEIPVESESADVVVASTLFSSLPSQSFEERVATEVDRILRPGCWLVWYDLRYPSPGNPSVHSVTRDRLERLFPGWDAELRPVTLLPPLARRLGVLTPVLYPTLNSLPWMRSHITGRLLKPGS